jgi:predicted ATPase/DNA-binding winged helix-turn-helix (wHTH) protein
MTAPFRFGRFEVQPDTRRLLDAGVPVVLGQRGFDLLLALVERRDRVVSKSELLDAVWPGLVVEENNLQVQVSALRKVLGPQAIATIPGRGYRFNAELDDPSGPAAASPVQRPAEARGNLPRHLPPLVGREEELAALPALVRGHRLVTVVGAGGIGKSRLTVACAHLLARDYPDGVWLVELAGVGEPELLANTVAQALGVRTSGPGFAEAELVASIGARRVLLVLDNCEHLLDAVVPLVRALVDGTQATLLATSQEPLRLPDEQQYRIAPLDEAGGVALLEARVRAIDARFALEEDNLDLARDICRRLDGLPLAIELAAARVPTLGLRGVRDKLDARFKLLTGGARSRLRRHQTLRAALEWSHHLLSDEESRVFRRLGVFAGGFTVELAQSVASDGDLDEWRVLDLLGQLVDKSLVTADPGDPPRYRLLESARAYALEQLAHDEDHDAFRRHALAMRDFIRPIDDANLDCELRSDEYAAKVLPELDNLRAAYAWASHDGRDPALALAIAAHCGALADYAFECGDWLLACRRWIDHPDVDNAVAARYWRALAASNMLLRVPMTQQADAAQRAQALYRSLGQPRRVVSSLIRLGMCQSRLGGDLTAAARTVQEARALVGPDWPAEFRIQLARRDAVLARLARRFDAALAFEQEELALSTATADRRLQVIARNNMVDLVWEMGPLEEAARVARAFEREVRATPGADADMDMMYANLAGILSELGEIEEAIEVARIGWPIQQRTRSYFIEVYVHLAWRRGDAATSAVLLGAADAKVRAGTVRQMNETRLISQARPGIEATLGPEEFARRHGEGLASSEAGIVAAISSTLR